MSLYEDVDRFLKQGGVDIFGVADISSFEEAEPGYRPQDILPTARSVLAYGIRMFRFPRMEKLSSENIPEGITEYTANFFIAAGMMDHLSYRLAMFMQDQGFQSLSIPAGPPYDGVGLRGIVSHKYAAELAGIGHRGLCDLLLTEKYGPRIRLTTVITEASLPARRSETGNLCEEHQNRCNFACVTACPVQAISQTDGIDKSRCDRYNEIVLSKGPIKIRCGRCVWACPVGTQG